MKRKTFIHTTFAMVILSVTCITLLSFKIKTIADDLWKQLGTTESDGKSSISLSFLEGHLSTFSLKNAMNISLGNRASVTTELLNYVKQYTTSPAF